MKNCIHFNRIQFERMLYCTLAFNEIRNFIIGKHKDAQYTVYDNKIRAKKNQSKYLEIPFIWIPYLSNSRKSISVLYLFRNTPKCPQIRSFRKIDILLESKKTRMRPLCWFSIQRPFIMSSLSRKYIIIWAIQKHTFIVNA